MTDVFDRAQEREEEMRQDALVERFRKAHPDGAQLPLESPLECLCGEPIPEGRRVAMPGVKTCIECQKDIERRGVSDWGMAE
ncbi:MAG: TraR/DksA family transcriptional regulator [Dechloromonas sp.]|nr:TraR/DksA family transcriptional regulator [Dechloromonas sp.]